MLLDLGTPRLRETLARLEPENMHRHFMTAEFLAHEFSDRGIGWYLFCGARLDECADDLAVLFVGEANDAGLEDGAVLDKAFFDL